ncbi:hypothetical protein TWF694_000394 [Orbilia ellipsospora]|uniref:BTB domain-containing protein n=1 Tax=Orbilia ellipsospora TaxID=2528407 RepID=A0AAV9XNF8_9PEZI
MAQPLRGLEGCSSFCTLCRKDCRCNTCGYCHTCQYLNAHNSGPGHTWAHECNVKLPEPKNKPVEGIGRFLKEKSDTIMRFCESEVFEIQVGKKTYYAHKEAIGSASAVLKRQVNSEMKEGTSKTIKLEDFADDPLAFGLFLQYSYFGGYGYDEDLKEDALVVHASVYVLSEKIEALGLKEVAFKKATALCASSKDPSRPEFGLVKVLQFALPEAVGIIYNGTYDSNTGKAPSYFYEFGSSTETTVKTLGVARDGFRMLLAKFAAVYIGELRKNESFMAVLETYPAFASDVLLFTGTESKITTDSNGNLAI